MFIPHTDADRDAMLSKIGAANIKELFKDVPEAYRFPDLDLEPAATEMEIVQEMEEISAANFTVRDLICFLGAGAYHHYSPAVVDAILRRGEFYTAYTPYQPEISQGTLQAIFEYQSLVTALTGMEVSNASHYDGATAVAEAINMAYAQFRGKRTTMVMSPALHPHYRQTAHTYVQGTPVRVIGDDESALNSGPESLYDHIDENTALVVVQYPDFLGRVYDYSALAEVTHQAGALLAVAVNPIALGLLKPPGEFDADIVTGEGQPLGIPLSYGGPYLGIFATKEKYVRKMAGRLVGETIDDRGQRAYVLTLTAREQHIRRDKATSNICTNQGLIALASAVYMSALGKHGLRQVASLCYHKAHYAAKRISQIPGFKLWSADPYFNEFVVECPIPAAEVNAALLEYGILGGYDLSQDYPQLARHLLVAVTEMNTQEDIELLVNALMEIVPEVSHA
ncbi:MAG: aminomethyl-transferring glycine dehydrogenase subunit GcvPA [Anaerolineales bacterium]|jgi:glycine dehydrogenase subunit 1